MCESTFYVTNKLRKYLCKQKLHHVKVMMHYDKQGQLHYIPYITVYNCESSYCTYNCEQLQKLKIEGFVGLNCNISSTLNSVMWALE